MRALLPRRQPRTRGRARGVLPHACRAHELRRRRRARPGAHGGLQGVAGKEGRPRVPRFVIWRRSSCTVSSGQCTVAMSEWAQWAVYEARRLRTVFVLFCFVFERFFGRAAQSCMESHGEEPRSHEHGRRDRFARAPSATPARDEDYSADYCARAMGGLSTPPVATVV